MIEDINEKENRKKRESLPLEPDKTLTTRFFALLIDFSIFSVIFSIIKLFFVLFWDEPGATTINIIRPICYVIYHILLTKKYGYTIGKYLMGLKVFVYNSNNRMDGRKAFKREIFKVIGSSISILVTIYYVLISNGFTYEDFKVFYKNNELIESYSAILTFLIYADILFAILSNDRRALHDIIGSTIVKRVHKLSKKKKFLAVAIPIGSFLLTSVMTEITY